MDTPLMKQYKEIKANYPSEILFFRLGDFYEMFFEDAKIASYELGLTLTSRNKEKEIEVPLAGIPYHSASGYIAKLVSKGYSVAICEQVEDPKQAKGIVKREVVRTVTPGTFMEMEYLDKLSNNYALHFKQYKSLVGISYIDITTGQFNTTELLRSDEEAIKAFLFRISPVEIIVEEREYKTFFSLIESYQQSRQAYVKIVEKKELSEKYLQDYFQVYQVTSLGLEGKFAAIEAAARLLDYVLEKNQFNPLPILSVCYENKASGVELNSSAQTTLELVNDKGVGSLFWVLNRCQTAMGARFLKQSILAPLAEKIQIEKRQDQVEFFFQEMILREEVSKALSGVLDLERLFAKVIYNSANGRDLQAILKVLNAAEKICEILHDYDFLSSYLSLQGCQSKLEEALHETPPFSIREGGIFRAGYHEKIDELRNLQNNGEKILNDIQDRERELTGIKNLKINYNRVFGYYIEVSRLSSDRVPEHYIRKQTLSNAERYITDELKEYERKILTAKEELATLEYQLFNSLCDELKAEMKGFYQCAQEMAELDFYISLAQIAVERNYIKPTIQEESGVLIRQGRHPIVEKLIGSDGFIHNDLLFDEEQNFMMITGPNMAGKSTYMKQNALIIIMAQMGSFVPATECVIGIVDKIFTRIGASDNLLLGESTFMVEMSEVSNILRGATSKSFIILDEVGRGTSTYDGLSIAWAISEYISKNIGALTLFATHYHELTELEKCQPLLKNYRFEVLEEKGEIHFLRKIVRGGADRSYGIEVAKLAGLPVDIIKRSKKILHELEQRKALVETPKIFSQLSLFDEFCLQEESGEEESIENNRASAIEEEILMLSLEEITPLDALNFLYRIKRELLEAKECTNV